MEPLYQPVTLFEQKIAEFCGSPYAVSVDSCTSALFLCCKYLQVKEVTIPSRTYCSVPCSIINAGGKVKFNSFNWQGIYQLKPYPIWDAALRLRKDMYIPKSYMCLSFQYRKHLPIGRGGMILTDDSESVRWFKLARFNGREELPAGQGEFKMIGWNMYMEPERASRGLLLMQSLKDYSEDLNFYYPDLSQLKIYG